MSSSGSTIVKPCINCGEPYDQTRLSCPNCTKINPMSSTDVFSTCMAPLKKRVARSSNEPLENEEYESVPSTAYPSIESSVIPSGRMTPTPDNLGGGSVSQKERPNEPYDVVMRFPSMLSLTIDGMIVEATMDQEITDPMSIKLDGAIVGMMGKENVGKTYLVNRIANTDFQSSTRLHTQGFSFKQAPKELLPHTILLDIAGTEAPIIVSSPQAHPDRVALDEIVRHVSAIMSDHVIHVVNSLTHPDQMAIEDTARSLAKPNESDGNSTKRLIVIHNLMRESVDTYAQFFESQIRPLYPDVKSGNGGSMPLLRTQAYNQFDFYPGQFSFTTAHSQDSKILIQHFFFLGESNDVKHLRERQFNNSTIAHLRHMLRTAATRRFAMQLENDICQRVKELLETKLPKYLEREEPNGPLTNDSSSTQTSNGSTSSGSSSSTSSIPTTSFFQLPIEVKPIDTKAAHSRTWQIKLAQRLRLREVSGNFILPSMEDRFATDPRATLSKGVAIYNQQSNQVEVPVPFAIVAVELPSVPLVTIRVEEIEDADSRLRGVWCVTGTRFNPTIRHSTSIETTSLSGDSIGGDRRLAIGEEFVKKYTLPMRLVHDPNRRRHLLQDGILYIAHYDYRTPTTSEYALENLIPPPMALATRNQHEAGKPPAVDDEQEDSVPKAEPQVDRPRIGPVIRFVLLLLVLGVTWAGGWSQDSNLYIGSAAGTSLWLLLESILWLGSTDVHRSAQDNNNSEQNGRQPS